MVSITVSISDLMSRWLLAGPLLAVCLLCRRLLGFRVCVVFLRADDRLVLVRGTLLPRRLRDGCGVASKSFPSSCSSMLVVARTLLPVFSVSETVHRPGSSPKVVMARTAAAMAGSFRYWGSYAT